MANNTSHMATIRVIVEFTIREGQLDNVHAIKSQMIERAQASNTLKFDTHLSEDKSRLHVLIDAADRAAIEALMSEIGPGFEKMVGSAHLSRLQVFGDVNETHKWSLSQFSPEYYADWHGVSY